MNECGCGTIELIYKNRCCLDLAHQAIVYRPQSNVTELQIWGSFNLVSRNLLILLIFSSNQLLGLLVNYILKFYFISTFIISYLNCLGSFSLLSYFKHIWNIFCFLRNKLKALYSTYCSFTIPFKIHLFFPIGLLQYLCIDIYFINYFF